MKFSEQWLREWVNPKATTEEIVSTITMAGLEVDEVEPVAGDFKGIVVGEILSTEPHPNADKLKVCQVAAGNETLQVVCGAPNATAGMKVPFALVGAVLPENFKIKKAKLRGVESFGMLCSEAELGISENHDGLMALPADAPVGEDIRQYLQLDDHIIDVDLTPNRADCLSIAGVAREVGVSFDEPVNSVEIKPVPPQIDEKFAIEIQAPDDCPRYIGRVIKDVDLSQPTPLWLKEKLRRSGIRSIDPVVDVTNYVMLELGQPMHGFDLAELHGQIIVRKAKAEEKLKLLDGQEITLQDDILLIADEKGPLAMAGIMGGEHSGVSEKTKDIFLESAFFNPITIAGKARRYGMHTDSSHRFERGVDYELPRLAAERATALILAICGGQPGPLTEAVAQEKLPPRRQVKLREAIIERLLGFGMAKEKVETILSGLGMQVAAAEENSWIVDVPSYRFDIEREEDLIEELARVFGYNQLPTTTPQSQQVMAQIPETKTPLNQQRKLLTTLGYQEVINYSFIASELQQLFSPDLKPQPLANPISADMAVMRTSLLPSLLSNVQYNLNRQQPRVRLFETGQVFIEAGNGLTQEQKIAGVVYGSLFPESWHSQKQSVDFYDLKGDVEALLALGNEAEVEIKPGKHTAMHPGQTAAVYCNGKLAGHLGTLHPELQAKLDLPNAAYLFELDLKAISVGKVTSFVPLSKFPEVRRDLAFIVNRAVLAQELKSVIAEKAGEWLKSLTLFDLYEGKGIEPGQKSVALGLTLQHPSRTLNDEEVNSIIDQVVTELEQKFQASLRK
ncbi:phenylalanine--tRNA ligase subunit beta [Endozoicomonas sp. SM1973]|uniref:Phenylalanine--tRNA ligase beta subunit n=1 Tax=Spartinivicinus marinus TaxID=2994442 RepID=A0A853I366_9GAMM|nr:phenylalanine--tRNA ligase subunit beta [Spartinivicinus marinus]MCX4025212.1 phenylalanine--tRNA ligase subunit beta [Spartinivicinus marinus]NYZ65932.1 phenylalanine--tRNA ligase subunit beta [Spartinivicinus marinus]